MRKPRILGAGKKNGRPTTNNKTATAAPGSRIRRWPLLQRARPSPQQQLRLLLLPLLLFSLLLLSSSSSATNTKTKTTKTTKTTTSVSAKKARSVLTNGLKTAVAGGLAGSAGTLTLYPLDAAKTLRQASPLQYRSVPVALRHLIQTGHAYRGCRTALLGAWPSSALYFGAYETAKRTLRATIFATAGGTATSTGVDGSQSSAPPQLSFAQRWLLHGGAAACGNGFSSALFVPKELLKQQLQYNEGGETVLHIARRIYHQQGVRGFYAGYRATLLRNVPAAVLRFGLYEEFRRMVVLRHKQLKQQQGDDNNNSTTATAVQLQWQLFVAGAGAGALASGLMTPLDVLKTRLSTGTCEVNAARALANCAQTVVLESGWTALWAGAGTRMLSAAAFSAVGFGTLELCKRWLGVVDDDDDVDEYEHDHQHNDKKDVNRDNGRQKQKQQQNSKKRMLSTLRQQQQPTGKTVLALAVNDGGRDDIIEFITGSSSPCCRTTTTTTTTRSTTTTSSFSTRRQRDRRCTRPSVYVSYSC